MFCLTIKTVRLFFPNCLSKNSVISDIAAWSQLYLQLFKIIGNILLLKEFMHIKFPHRKNIHNHFFNLWKGQHIILTEIQLLEQAH